MTNTLDGAKSPKLALQILLIGAVVKTRHDERLESITADVLILVRVVYPNSTSQHESPHPKPDHQDIQFFGPSVKVFSASASFSRFLRSRASSQLSVGWYSISRSYSASAGRNWAIPETAAVLRCSGA